MKAALRTHGFDQIVVNTSYKAMDSELESIVSSLRP